MNTANPARGLPRNTTTAGRCCSNCNRRLRSSFLEHTLCPTCYYSSKVCAQEGVETLRELALASTDAVMWRVADVLRRSGIEDAEPLIRRLERLIS